MATDGAALNASVLTGTEELWVERVVAFSSQYNTTT